MTAILMLMVAVGPVPAHAAEPVQTVTRAHLVRTPVAEDERAVLKVRVRSLMSDPVEGRIIVSIGSERCAKRPLPDDGSALVVRLPRLAKGRYQIIVRFIPSGVDSPLRPSSTLVGLKVVHNRH